MDNLTVEIFKPIFEEQLQLPLNESCKKCDAALKKPLLPWIVGGNFNKTKERVLFVGKPHRGQAGDEFPSGIIDSTKPHLEWLMSCSWPYWKYTRDIAEQIYGEDAWNSIAITNIIKCTNTTEHGNTVDITSEMMADCCINKIGVIFKEIQTLKPNKIIFYTFSLYKEFLIDMPERLGATSVSEIHGEWNRRPCGNKYLGWWERRMSVPWCNNLNVLVTGHPERMKNTDYVKLLSDWILAS